MEKLHLGQVKPPTPHTIRGTNYPSIEGWELVGLAFQSQLAQVYRARPASAAPDRPPAYALKVLCPQWESDPRAREMFRREILLGRLVRHPHLLAVLGGQVRQPPIYVITPWLEGKTLAQCLAEGWRPDVPVALWIARQVAEALDALHRAGWMHGDIKPENIHLAPSGHVTVLDLGFARRPKAPGNALDRCVVGSWAYLAPEWASGVYRPDIRSDLYSLGVVLFQMLTGRLPFEADSSSEMMRMHRQERAPELSKLAPAVPPGVAQLVQTLLAKEPLRRPQTPEELIDRLVRLEIKRFADRHWLQHPAVSEHLMGTGWVPVLHTDSSIQQAVAPVPPQT
ncbi:MAG: serine/threonine protein kinase [Thermoguttaceae bacterium]|nr:serine/threonine protein kinase [Thermoguttaceae bacterium]MDW8038254.1 serine/threonine-protein kinase [Thermoguttaceae bacterium]